jgi:hypothetical protein
MHKLLRKIASTKKVEMRDIVSPTPSRNASKVLKAAIQKSYVDQQLIRDKAAAIRSN